MFNNLAGWILFGLLWALLIACVLITIHNSRQREGQLFRDENDG